MHPEPVAIPLVHVRLHLHTAMLVVAAAAGLWLAPWWAQSLEGLNRRRVLLASVVLGLACVAGGRLHFLLNYWSSFDGGPLLSALELSSGGLHAAGAIAALAIAAPFVLRLFGIPLGKFVDGALAPTVGIGIAIARLGCFLQGCCFGTVCDWPWCVTFPRTAYVYAYHKALGVLPAAGLRSAPVHPLQLYFAAAGLLLTAVALWFHSRKRYDGQVGLVVLLVYGISAAVLEFFRADSYPRPYWGPLPQLEWSALALTGAAAVALTVAGAVHRRR